MNYLCELLEIANCLDPKICIMRLYLRIVIELFVLFDGIIMIVSHPKTKLSSGMEGCDAPRHVYINRSTRKAY